ncbi:MAG TPA: Na+/H+ antiporter NhaA [Tepidisphaeraceae bacterium]|nr:Na+/H+ antiporter NhaA [Tepidisphaeraceae bacterium]
MSEPPIPLTPSRIEPLLRPINAFLAAESAGGIVLISATLIALLWANSAWSFTYHQLWHTKLTIDAGHFSLDMSLEQWVNDGLMAVFFLLVGLEIKRELLVGELASMHRATLPMAAATGGMVVPALIFAAFNVHQSSAAGWGIPMATDIAFAVGVMALVGRAVPTSVRVFLLAVAIVDDLGAVLVIALFYTSHISGIALGVAGLFLAGLILLNLLRVHQPWPYMMLGAGLWLATLYSGLHSTIAGVLLAFTIPATRQIEEMPYVDFVRNLLYEFEYEAVIEPTKITEDQSHILKSVEEASQAVQTPLARVEHALLKPVNFLIVPLFAIANAGVVFEGGSESILHSRVMWGVLLGLVIGKPLGVLGASWLAIKSGMATLPAGATWRHMLGVAVLCGIGFTMSLFVTHLAFPGSEEHVAAAKIAILAASIIAGAAGAALIVISGKPARVEAK